MVGRKEGWKQASKQASNKPKTERFVTMNNIGPTKSEERDKGGIDEFIDRFVSKDYIQ